jgi:L-Ala-D/L-Glu epimerase
MNWEVQQIKLPLLFTFKIARNSSVEKTNFIVRIKENEMEASGECAPNIRYGETIEETNSQLQSFVSENVKFGNITEVIQYLSKQAYFQSVKNAIETCYINYYCKKNQLSIAHLFNIAETGSRKTMFTIPIMPVEELESFYKNFNLRKFSLLKIKIDKNTAVDNIRFLSQLVKIQNICVDANEAFTNIEEYLAVEKEISDLKLEFIEQPFAAKNISDYIELKPISQFPIFGDESIIAKPKYEQVMQQFHGVNVKMMKTGGFVEAVTILQKAKSLGLKTMIGCMVETSIGISNALKIASLADYLDLDSYLYIKNEPFNFIVSENDILSLNNWMSH